MPEDAIDEIELGEESASEPGTALEEKYRSQMRQIVSQKIELPISTLPAMLKEQINLSPEFQRRNRWDTKRRSRFIESIIMNVPVPPVFLGEDEYGKYVVLDGRQRLTAISEFLRNTYRLEGLEVWNEINGRTYDDLEKQKLSAAITRRFIPAIVVLKESSPVVKYDVFDRLNTGGLIANEMEIRNAIYPGEFNSTLHQLSRNPDFRRLWNIPLDDLQAEKNQTFAQMKDLELVLRFFALLHPEQINLRYKDYLSEFMEGRNRAYRQDPSLPRSDAALFSTAVQNVSLVFGNDAFRRPDDNRQFSSNKSAPLADAEMISLSEVQSNLLTAPVCDELKAGFIDLCLNNEGFRRSITAGTNGKSAIATRVRLAKELVVRIVQRG
jgi:hypothetical protein